MKVNINGYWFISYIERYKNKAPKNKLYFLGHSSFLGALFLYIFNLNNNVLLYFLVFFFSKYPYNIYYKQDNVINLSPVP